mgnify:CR=1 FL=1
MIGGNTIALIQVKDDGTKNSIGERQHVWSDVFSLDGWLDYQGGQNAYQTYDAKVQETTHIFMCDFHNCKQLSKRWVWNPFSFVNGVITADAQEETKVDLTSQNGRMVINGDVYDILMIDDPMGMHKHLEFYLKYVGGGLGV